MAPLTTGLMQDYPLVVSSILDHAEAVHSSRSIVTHTVEGGFHTYTYGDMAARAKLLAQVLINDLGVKKGDVVATMAWNTYRHLELWYAIMGIGAVCHTLNPRLFSEQLTYIANHAEDTILFLDSDLVKLGAQLAPAVKTLRKTVIMTDAHHMPSEGLFPSAPLCYEDLVAMAAAKYSVQDFKWPPVDENAACGICYTSGTTGNPKGVVYSHRSNVLHAMQMAPPDVFNLKMTDVVLPIVPMFHANAWALAFACPMIGSGLVLPGPQLDGPTVYSLMEEYKVTFSAAVPTVWLALIDHLQTSGSRLSTLKSVVIGGSAVPRKVLETFKDKYGVLVKHAWGMTELSPMGSIFMETPKMKALEPAAYVETMLKQGRPFYGVQMKITDDAGKTLPKDGKAFGHLMVRGPAVAKQYLKGEGGEILDVDGYFDTGDVATLDQDGFMGITDRAKDVIKSGGEWISSIEVENAAVGHPEVAEAAVIGLEHPKWGERPLLVVVPKSNPPPSKDDVLGFIIKSGQIAKWWVPEDVQFVAEIPHTATGKIDKKTIRKQFKDYEFPKAKL